MAVVKSVVGRYTAPLRMSINASIAPTEPSGIDPPARFTYHANHGHIHFDDWTVFRLRVRNEDGSPGDVVATGAKTSFCIIELRRYDSSLPGHNDPPGYNSCGQVQGLRPGWSDVYGSSLYGQVIDLTGVADGIYYLEGDIDPDNKILESNEENNSVMIPVAIGSVPGSSPDPYEENDSKSVVDGKTEGAPNSPNLGLVLNETFIPNLSMEDNGDYFKFKIHEGNNNAYVRIESPYLRNADLDMQLLNSSGTVIDDSTGSYSWEQISLKNRPAGTYYIRVFRAGSGNNPLYYLRISPTPNDPPFLELNQPSLNPQYVEKSYETFEVIWNGGDPNQDPKLVSILRSRVKFDHANAEPIPGYQDMPNGQGSVNINTAEFSLGLWYILGVGSDGGAQTEAWAPGAVHIYIKGDFDYDGHCHMEDFEYGYKMYRQSSRGGPGPEFRAIADMDRDGDVDMIDMRLLFEKANNDHG